MANDDTGKPDDLRALLQFISEQNVSYRETLRGEGEANRKLLFDTVRVVSIPVGLLIAAAAILGFKSISDLKESIRTEARQETKSEIVRMQSEIREKLNEQFQTPALQQMVKGAAVASTKAAAEELIKAEVAKQVRSRVDAEGGRIEKAVVEQTRAAVKQMGPQIDSLVRDSVDVKVESQVQPVLKQMTDLKGEADLQLLITRMNADDALAFDALMETYNSGKSPHNELIRSALRTAFISHSEGFVVGRQFNQPLTAEQIVAQLSNPESTIREAAVEALKKQNALLPKLMGIITSDPSLNVRAAAYRTFNTWTEQHINMFDKGSAVSWWEANKAKWVQ